MIQTSSIYLITLTETWALAYTSFRSVPLLEHSARDRAACQFMRRVRFSSTVEGLMEEHRPGRVGKILTGLVDAERARLKREDGRGSVALNALQKRVMHLQEDPAFRELVERVDDEVRLRRRDRGKPLTPIRILAESVDAALGATLPVGARDQLTSQLASEVLGEERTRAAVYELMKPARGRHASSTRTGT